MIDKQLQPTPDTVAVLGLGISGRGAVRYFVRLGVRVLVSEQRARQNLTEDELAFLVAHGVETEFGGHTFDFLAQADLVLVSPGIPWHLAILDQLRADGVAVQGELAVAGPRVAEPIVAITGTNGKTTVTELTAALLRREGRKVFVGGNIGRSLFDYLLDGEQADCLVLEVSSFQLESAGSFRPQVALLLNISPDHLDRHGDMAAYAAAKLRIFDRQQAGAVAIVSGDDLRCREYLGARNLQGMQLFGHGEECRARIVGTAVYHARGEETEKYELVETRLADPIGLLNAAAAILAVHSLGCSPLAIRAGLAHFSPGAHRLSLVAEIAGVSYYDDSKATNTGAVLAALENFAANVILIAGGRDKGDDYSLLQTAVALKVRLLILIGEAASDIAAAMDGLVETRFAGSMEQAVQLAAGQAQAGDTVLLSPACASFDMFDSYAHRGRVFQALVHGLASAGGKQQAMVAGVDG